MRKVRFTETEQKIYEILKKGLYDLDGLKLRLEQEVGHPYARGVVAVIVTRLCSMGVGVQKKKVYSKYMRRERVNYTAAP